MRRKVLFGCGVALLSAVASAGDVMEPLPAGAVTLVGGLERELRLSTEGWILGDVPYRAFADFFRKGRPNFAMGEMWGKFVRSGCMFYRSSRDPRIAARMKEAVEDLLSTERENGSISCTPVGEQPGDRGGDLWERKYVLLGLEGYYADVEADPRVLASMRRQADAILAQIGPAPKKDVRELGWSPNHVESSTLLEPILRLYALTGESRYLAFARYLVDCGGAKGSNLIDMACGNVPPYLMGGVYPKAYETTSYFEGLADYVRATGDARVRTAVLNYFRLVRDRELTIVGNGGADQPYHPAVCGEAWSETAKEQTNPEITRMMETCTGVTWMKYCSHVLRLTGDCSAAEAIERYVYNGLIGAMQPDGRGFSYVNLLDGVKVTNRGWGWNFDGKPVTCCNLNGPMGLAYIPYVAVMQAKEGPVVNLYNGLVATAKTAAGRTVKLEMTTDYPRSGKVRLVVTPEREERFSLRLRNPGCSAKTTVAVNGLPVETGTNAVTYLVLDRTWKAGDAVEVSFDLRVRLVKGPRGVNRAGDGRVAVVYGPVVLARDERLDPAYDRPLGFVPAVDGTLAARRLEPAPGEARLGFEVMTRQGPVVFTDYASVDCWKGSHVRTWLRQTEEAAAPADTVPVGLKVNHLAEPGHVGGHPNFSWRMQADRAGARQTAYRLKVDGVWDSGVVEDNRSVGVSYAGPALASATRYAWSVSVRDETGAWSPAAGSSFSTGLVRTEDWGNARWIAPDTPPPHGYKTAAFRREFAFRQPVREAWLSVAAAGVFEATVNGERMTSDVLCPGATHAEKTRQACTYEVTRLLKLGADRTNVLDCVVSTGWSRDRIAARNNRPTRKLDPMRPGALLAVLTVRYADGTEQRFGTDETWQVTETDPLVAAGIYEGETYDARGPGKVAWRQARLNDDFRGEVRNFSGPPVTLRRDLELKPVSAVVTGEAEGASETSFGTARVLRRQADGEPVTLAPGEQLVVDFGQNASAVPEFVFEAAAGTEVTVRHAEMLNEGGGLKSRGNDGPAGTPYLANLRSSFAGIRYTCRGGGLEAYRPAFTFFGYRYLGVTANGPLTVRRVRSVPVTSVRQGQDTGWIETDNPRLNRLLENCRWGMYSNYLSVPTDCPQRDERVGWTADTQVFVPAAAYLADAYAFLSKWMGDMRDSQRDDGCFAQIAPENAVRGAVTGWTDAGVIVPYLLWRRYGDLAAVRENWTAMTRYLDYLEKRGATDAQPYGDWLSYEYGADMEWLKPVREKLQLPRKRLLTQAYRVWVGRMMSEMAAALGRPAEAKRADAFAAQELKALQDTCLTADGRIRPECDGQCSGLFALYLKLLPNAEAVAETRRTLRANFRQHGDTLRTGFLGTAILLDAVTEGLGDVELAYTLLLQDKNPSWLYSVDQGATTIWERWNSYTKDKGFGPVAMNSFNHYAYGAVAGWMFSTIAGIRADAPGFKRIRLAPRPDRRIGRVTATFDSPYGRIESAWRYEADGRWVWRFAVPANTTARVELPGEKPRDYGPGRHEVSRRK